MKEVLTDLDHVIAQARKGDPDAQARLFKSFGAAMYNICVRMTGDRVAAEDILQEVFIMAFVKLNQLKDANHFGGWLRTITVNECIRTIKKKIPATIPVDEFHELHDDEDTNWWESVTLEQLHEEIKCLPDSCRMIFCLYVLEDYTHHEIANKMGISESTSKTQYRRGRQLLKERITRKMKLYGQF